MKLIAESDVLSMQLVHCDFIVLFCTGDIYCVSVRLGEGSSNIFFPCLNVIFFLTGTEGLEMEGVVNCTDCKAH